MDRYRSILEVLKFADVLSVLQATVVSAIWYRCADSDEFYRQRCEDEDFDYSLLLNHFSAKSIFRTQTLLRTRLVSLSPAEIRVLSCLQERVVVRFPLESHLEIQRNSLYVFLPDGSILLYGNAVTQKTEKLKRAYIVSITGSGYPIQNTIKLRYASGAIFYKHATYVFGGLQYQRQIISLAAIDSCEMLDASPWPIPPTRHWMRLPNMLYPRSEVNPCGFEGLIYLISSGTGECFNILKAEFSLLSLNFAIRDAPYLLQYGRRLLVIGDRVIFQIDKLTLERLTPDQAFLGSGRDYPHSMMRMPRLVSNKVYWICSTGGALFRLDLETLVMKFLDFN